MELVTVIRRLINRVKERRSATNVKRAQRRVDADAVRLEHRKKQGSKFHAGGGGGG